MPLWTRTDRVSGAGGADGSGFRSGSGGADGSGVVGQSALVGVAAEPTVDDGVDGVGDCGDRLIVENVRVSVAFMLLRWRPTLGLRRLGGEHGAPARAQDRDKG